MRVPGGNGKGLLDEGIRGGVESFTGPEWVAGMIASRDFASPAIPFLWGALR